MLIKDKYDKYGFNSLEKDELLELILDFCGYDMPAEKVIELNEKYGGLVNIFSNTNSIDMKYSRFFMFVKLIKDFSKRAFFNKLVDKTIITNNTQDVIDYLKSELIFQNDEIFGILLLNNRLEVIKFIRISKGTIDKSCVFIRDIIKYVLEFNANNVIIAHNHPSGSLIVSENDKKVTSKIKKALALLDVNVIDHIVVSKCGHFSFAQGGLL